MTKFIHAILILLTACSISWANENELITNFDEKTVPVINEELRKLDEVDDDLLTRVTTLEGNTAESVVFSVHKSAGQTVSTGSYVLITFDTESIDTDAAFASSKFTVTTAGKYFFNVQLTFNSLGADKIAQIAVYKNGSLHKEAFFWNPTSGGDIYATISFIDTAAVGAYYEVYAQHNHGSDRTLGSSSASNTWFEGYLVSE